MNLSIIEMLMAALIFAAAIMCCVFIANQKKGQAYIVSLDNSLVWGGIVFVVECCFEAVFYAA